jgi:hypothetical protein
VDHDHAMLETTHKELARVAAKRWVLPIFERSTKELTCVGVKNQ